MINLPNTQLLEQICLDNYIYDPITNPLDMLKSFFSYQDLQQQLKRLKEWKTYVLTFDYLEISTLFNPLYHHKMMCNLINAAWMLSQYPDPLSMPKDLSVKEQEVFLTKECLNANSYPKHLSTAELIDPYLSLNSFFEKFTLRESHQQLYEWLNVGLSPNVNITASEPVISFYKSIRNLLECCWLILYRANSTATNKDISQQEESEALVASEDDEVIRPEVLSGFKQFLNIVPAQRLNRGLRKMLIDYLFYNINGLPTDFEETLSDFYWLTDLLDEIQGKAIDSKFM